MIKNYDTNQDGVIYQINRNRNPIDYDKEYAGKI